MDPGQYGPFANIVALASALVAVFGTFLFNMLGRIERWTWLAGGTPAFLVAAGPRILAVAIMAGAYVLIDDTNFVWFVVAALVIGVLGFIAVVRFGRLHEQHVVKVPMVGESGGPLRDQDGEPAYETVVIGTEASLRPEAGEALKNARQRRGGLSLKDFMSGYGAQKLNDPEALWPRKRLVDIKNQLTTTLMYVVLSAVTTLYLAALAIDVAG